MSSPLLSFQKLHLFTMVSEVAPLKISDLTISERKGQVVVRSGKETPTAAFPSMPQHVRSSPTILPLSPIYRKLSTFLFHRRANLWRCAPSNMWSSTMPEKPALRTSPVTVCATPSGLSYRRRPEI
ncbi:hypothetical protein HKBW3C_01013, partial [Candidatus Hakubella thermalkaliphila]